MISSDIAEASRLLSPKFLAIEPMINEIDGRKSPAIIDPIVPMANMILSFLVLYEKNLWNDIVLADYYS
jgi:hypothetical protein